MEKGRDGEKREGADGGRERGSNGGGKKGGKGEGRIEKRKGRECANTERSSAGFASLGTSSWSFLAHSK